MIFRRRIANEKLLLFFEYLWAYYQNEKVFCLYGDHIAKRVTGHKDGSSLRHIFPLCVKEGLFEYKDRQKDGKGGIRYNGVGKDKWASTTYQNLNVELLLKNIKELREKLNLEEKTYTEEDIYTIQARVKKEDRIGISETERETANTLYSEVDDYNKNVPNIAKITFLKELKKRGSNILCQTKNPDKHPDDNKRKEILSKELGKYFEFDINGSIYRLSYNLSHNQFFDYNNDIYKHLYEDIFHNASFNRTAFKSILMPIYMKGEIFKIKAEQLNRVKNQKEIGERDKLLLEYANNLSNISNSPYEDILRDIYYYFKREFNIGYRKKHIFIDETFIMVMTANLIRKKYNRKSFYLYDCLYIEGDSIPEKDLYDLYHEATLRYKTIYQDTDREITRKKKVRKDRKERVNNLVKIVGHNLRKTIYKLINKGYTDLEIIGVI